MALSVTLTASEAPALTYRLKCTDFVVDYGRGALSSPLPTGLDPILIDLGFFKPTISISGTIRSEGTETDGATTIPTKRQLEDFLTDERYIAGVNVIQISIVVGATTDTYDVAALKGTFTLPAARADLWDFKLVFVARSRA